MSITEPGSPEWLRIITASKVAAIIGVSPWESPYSMWMKMAGRVTPEPTSTVQRRGQLLEPAIIEWWREQHDVSTLVQQVTYTHGDWAAATPDAVVAFDDDTQALLEVKTAARTDDWDNDGQTSIDGIPIYYWTQTQWQMHVSGIHTTYVALLGPFLEFSEYRIDYDPEHSTAVEAHCREFYDSLSADVPPPLDDTVATYNTVRRLHDGIDKTQTLELVPGVAAAYIDAVNVEKEAVADARMQKAQLLDLMGDAAYAECQGVRIARRQATRGTPALIQVAKEMPAQLQEPA